MQQYEAELARLKQQNQELQASQSQVKVVADPTVIAERDQLKQ